MKIETLHVYGFGFLKDVVIDFHQPLHVIYGKNEAGKSTILAFIETMLFGFPKRQQQYNYAPKSGGVYGGKLIASIQHAGKLIIERVKNREPEESLIYLDDEKLDETRLHSLLQRVDRSLFQQLFSTRLDHLREMEKLDEQALNRFLLGASVSGHLSLHAIEAELDEKRMELFRPQGRKPVLNVMASQLQELAETVKKSERLRETYERLLHEKTSVIDRLQQLETERKQLQNEHIFYERLKDAAPLYEQLKIYQHQLSEMPESLHFPERGVERFEQLQTKIVDLEAQRRSLEQRIEKLKQSLPDVNTEWLGQKDALDLLRERSESYQMKLEQLFHATERIKQLKHEIQLFLEQAGLNWTHEMIANVDTSIMKAETLEHFAKEIKELSEEYNELEKELALIQNRLKTAEKKAAEIEQTLLSHDEKQKLQILLEKHDRIYVEQEKAFIERMLERYDSEIQELQLARKFSFALFGVFAAIAIVAFFLLPTNMIFTFTLVFLLLDFSAFVYYSERNRRKKRDYLLRQKNKEKQKLDELNSERDSFGHIESAKQKWLLDEERRKEWLIAKHHADELRAEFNEILKRHDSLKAKKQAKIDEAKRWAKDNHIPESFPVSYWPEWFQQLKEVKKKVQTLQNLQAEKERTERWITEYEGSVYELCECFRLSAKDSITSLLLKLQRLIEEEKAKQMQAENIEKQIAEEQKRLDDCKEKKNHYEKEVHQLFKEADCENEEQFMMRGKQFAEKRKLLEEMNNLNLQIHLYVKDEKTKQKMEAELERGFVNTEEKLKDISRRLEEIEKEHADLLLRKAELEYEMKAIEEGGEYDEYLQKLEFQKTQFRNYALEWATYTVALNALQKTKERYRKERMPKVIQLAAQYFSQMTNEAYRSISVPIDGDMFFVESRDGIRFFPHELSRGTQEQLYLSLRLALISAYPSSFPFPILLDDIFVHFDKERRKQAFQLLHQLAETHQIIVFTCHKEIAKQWQRNVIKIEKQ